MSASGILRPGHVGIRVMDMSAAVNHYTRLLGLKEVARDNQGRVFLKAWDEWEHHSVVLRETNQAGMDYMGWRVASPEIMRDLARDIQRSGLVEECRWIEEGEHPQTGERFRFTVGTGHAMELYAYKEETGTAVGTHNPEAWPENEIVGIAPTRFDHCLLYGTGFDDTVKLFREILQFDLTEQVTTPEGMQVGAFLTCSNKAHDVAFIRHNEPGKLHHISFNLESWEQVLRAADLISMKRCSLDIGPTRHGITRGTTVYFFDPSGNRNEVFCGGYISYPDRPVITWDADELGAGIFYHNRALNDTFLTVVS